MRPMIRQIGRPIIVRRNAAIGDAVGATVVADRLIEMGYQVKFQCHHSIIPVIKRHPKIEDVQTPQGMADVDLDGCYENDPKRRSLHFSQMFFFSAEQQLSKKLGINLGSPLNCKPVLRVSESESLSVIDKLEKYPRPWVFLCPRSDSWPNRQVPDHIWEKTAPLISGTKFWLATTNAPKGIIDLKCRSVGDLPVLLSVADLLVSVDTGPLHIAAALGVPCVALGQASSPELHLSDQCDFVTINPRGLDCLNCQKNICPKDAHLPPCQNFMPEFIAAWANAKLRPMNSETVSAVIPIYKPDVQVLAQCLDAVLPQVSEVIVTMEAGSVLPNVHTLRDPKVRIVRKPLNGIGYSRNVNFGARHSTGRYLLILNDDVFLSPNAVQKLKEECKDGVGAVAGLLRYPDGRIYHAGKYRNPGMRGWGHVDINSKEPSIKSPMVVENVNGACLFMPRKAFYDVGAFDEDYFGYASDDDTCMKLGHHGWRVIYTPHAHGVHLEGQSFAKLPQNKMDLIRDGNATFERKWGWWYEKQLRFYERLE